MDDVDKMTSSIYVFNDFAMLNREKFNEWMMLVSEEKRHKILQYRFYKHACQSLSADVLSRYVLGKYSGLKNRNITFENDNYGKPFLRGYPNIYFNVSHYENLSVCAIDTSPIGVDVEKIHKVDCSAMELVCSDEEYKIVNKSINSEKEFLRFWTLKESYTKAIGLGLSYSPRNITFNLGNDIRSSESKWNFKLFEGTYRNILLQ